ncbi:hypothetical protein ACLOJK_029612 [Asimina triloba]
MASSSSSKNRRPGSSSRLQNRAPTSIQVAPASNYASGWKIAIPLLSPVIEPEEDQFVGASSRQAQEDLSSHQDRHPSSSAAAPGKLSFRSWQHPAAPFACQKMASAPRFVLPQSSPFFAWVRACLCARVRTPMYDACMDSPIKDSSSPFLLF